MFKSRVLPVMILALTMSAAAHAGGDSDKPDPEKKVCKSEKMTGSLTRVNRICMTQAQWDKLAETTAKSVDDINKYQNRPDRAPSNPSAAQGFGG